MQLLLDFEVFQWLPRHHHTRRTNALRGNKRAEDQLLKDPHKLVSELDIVNSSQIPNLPLLIKPFNHPPH